MPPPSNRMTKNQERNLRYRPGKAEEPDYESDSEEEDDFVAPQQTGSAHPAPRATTFPSRKKSVVNASKAEQRKPVVQQAQQPDPDEDLEGFVTASESSEEEIESDEGVEEDEESSEEEESSSEEEPQRPMIVPKFIPKSQRSQQDNLQEAQLAERRTEEEELRRKEKANELLQGKIERDAAARAAGRKAWDDDDVAVEDEVDDTDGLDPEAEKAAWKLRELKRVQRDRLVIVEKEKEREEIERRKNLSAEEREAEDREFLEQQKEEREGRGKMAYMQKYFHKGAFFNGDEEQDEEVKAALSRDLAGATFVDEASKDSLPDYMRIRDMSKLGRKGRTKYKDLKSEDTGRWGMFDNKRKQYDGVDDRFRPDERGNLEKERTGANAAPVGERRRREDDGHRENVDKRARYS